MLSMNRLIQNLAQPLMFQAPNAVARIKGSAEYPEIEGEVLFYSQKEGTLVMADIDGLPRSQGMCGSEIFGFHIHEGGCCTGNAEDPFSNAGGHYNPKDCPHPGHAGDLPPLFGNNGHACLAMISGRFRVDDVVGRTMIIHEKPDDFATQSSGNSGKKMACGIIELWRHSNS